MVNLSYHDVVVIVNGTKHVIADNYAYELRCTRAGGWTLWWHGTNNEPRLLGGEFDSDDFRIEVGGTIVCEGEEDEE